MIFIFLIYEADVYTRMKIFTLLMYLELNISFRISSEYIYILTETSFNISR